MRTYSSWVFSMISCVSSVAMAASIGLGAPAGAQPPGPTVGRPGVTVPTALGDALVQRFGPGVKVTWNASRTAPRRLSGISVATLGTDPGERARGFVLAHAALLGLEGDMKVEDVRVFTPRDPTAGTHPGARLSLHSVRLRQLWNGLPVEGRSVVVRLDDADRVTSVVSDLGPLVVPTPTQVVDPASVTAMLKATYQIVGINTPQKVVLAIGTGGRVAWKVGVSVLPLQASFFVWVDVETGRALKEAPAAFDQGLQDLPLRAEVTP